MVIKVIEIVHSKDSYGTDVVLVPLTSTDKKAIINRLDYDHLVSIGCGLPWKWHNGNVHIRTNGRYVSIPRLILDVGNNIRVSFKDRNPFNLRLDNLFRHDGYAEHKASDLIKADGYRRRPPIIKEVTINGE